jgi:hypothetical protein
VASWEVHREAYARLMTFGPERTYRDVAVELVHEPANPDDRNAVAVLVEGLQVGYIPRDYAPAWSAFIAEKNRAGMRVRASGQMWAVRGRGDEPDFGIWLSVPVDPADYARWEAGRPEREAAAERERIAREQARRERHAARERAEQERCSARKQVDAERRTARERERQAEPDLDTARRAAGLCLDCGAPLKKTPGARGRPPVRCELHRAAAKSGKAMHRALHSL